MAVSSVYLDSSSVAKRYLAEKGTDTIDSIYESAETGKLMLFFSVWNIGELLGVIDRHRSRGQLSEKELNRTVVDFITESMKLFKLGCLVVMPLDYEILLDSWQILMAHHIYVADALQIASALKAKCPFLLTADKDVAQIAKTKRIEAFNVERQEDEIRKVLGL